MNTKKDKNSWKAPRIVFGIFFVFICVLFLQYCYVALFPVVYGTNMQQFAANRNTYARTLYSKRGNIYDSDGNVLAQNVTSYTVIAYLSASRTTDINNPNHVVDKEGTAEKLSTILNMSKEYILSLLKIENVYQVELGPGGRGITELTKDAIQELYLPGIDFVESSKRYYPNGDFASYIIGYAKANERYVETNGKTVLTKTIDGELGIEVKYDEMLKGTNGYIKYQQDRFGYKIPETSEEYEEPQDGNDIYLTIDSNIQRFVESAVKEAYEKYDPEWMLFEVMDAKTGDILASVATPSFDPNIMNITNYENSLVSFTYEPGSVMKTFTYMCTIEEGTYRGNDTYMSGTIQVGDTVIKDWNGKGWGTITYDLGYEYSSNVAITNIVQKFIDKNQLKQCLIDYGFGQKSDIELPRELEGSINFNYPLEVASAGFGQGISVTPIQMLQALTIISNNGKMLQPHIISKIVNPNTNEVVYERQVTESEQKVSESTVAKMRELMWNTVNATNPGTTGSGFKIEGFDIIGKTGTAEIYNNATNSYLKNGYIYSFSGMFPYDDPQIIVFTSAKLPKTGAASLLKESESSIIKSIAKYLNIYGDKTEEAVLNTFRMPQVVNSMVVETTKKLEELGAIPVILGNGDKIIAQYPSASVEVVAGDKVYLHTNSNEILLPDFRGYTRSETITLLDMIGVKYKFSGYGQVISQSIAKDTLVIDDMEVIFTLENKYDIKEQENDSEE